MSHFLIQSPPQLTSEPISSASLRVHKSPYWEEVYMEICKWWEKERREVGSGAWKIEVLDTESLRMNELGSGKVDALRPVCIGTKGQ